MGTIYRAHYFWTHQTKILLRLKLEYSLDRLQSKPGLFIVLDVQSEEREFQTGLHGIQSAHHHPQRPGFLDCILDQ